MKESNKRALVLSGGGIKGAYQVGVLKKWLKEDGLDYDILCGVSVGALNALKLAAIPLGDSSEAYDNLYNIWHDLTVSRIFCGWKPFGKISALWKWSIFDSSPLIKLIKSDFDIEKIRNSNKNVRIGAVCLNTGEKYFSSENDFNLDEWAVASASLPVIMKPKIINGKWWIDGGIKVSAPIGQAIRLGAKYIDVISCSPGNSYTKEWRPSGRWWSVLDIAYRSLDLMTDRIMAADFHSIGLDNDLVVSKYSDIKIRIIRPSVSLNDDLFNFDSSDISKMIDRGYSDAKNCQ
jgi:NTE family protein